MIPTRHTCPSARHLVQIVSTAGPATVTGVRVDPMTGEETSAIYCEECASIFEKSGRFRRDRP